MSNYAENKMPKLRFNEFKESWSKEVLGDISKISKGKGISKSQLDKNGDTKCILFGQLYTTYNEIISNVVSKTSLPAEGLVFSKSNDVIIPCSGETHIDIARASCVKDDNIALGGDMSIIRSENNGVFMSYYLSNKKKIDIACFAQGSSVIHLYPHHLKKLQLNLPTLTEQEKIAEFLSSVEKKIQLLEKKKEQLKLYKKAVMQKIFSREIRFKDDNGNSYPDWEKKKLGDIGEFKSSSVDKKIKEGEELVFLINYMNVYNHEELKPEMRHKLMRVSASSSQILSFNLKKGDILFTPSSETPYDIGRSSVIFSDLEDTLYSYHLMRFRPSINLNLLYSHYFCNISPVLRQLSKLCAGSTRFTISVGNFSKVQIELPCLGEQKKIADFLSGIDSKIETASTQIDKTKKFKKGLLQQMFV